MLTREQLLRAIQAALEPLAAVESLVEGGSTAFGRADEWSDLDLIADVHDGAEGLVFDVLEATFRQLVQRTNPACAEPILVRKTVPQPAWHGMAQRFYKLAETSAWLVLDIALRPTSKPGHFSEQERHGTPRVLFDKTGIAQTKQLDMVVWREKVAGRIAELRDHFALFGNFAEKEVLRGRPLDASSMYHGLVLRPLVELLRVKHCPERYDYALRYLQYDLPAEAVQRLDRLAYPADLAALGAAQADARQWAGELLEELQDASG